MLNLVLISPLIDEHGTLVCDSKAKANALSKNFDGKQCRNKINIPLSWHPEPKFKSRAFRSNEVLNILTLTGVDAHGGTDPHGIFSLSSRKIKIK